jgi:hypothetical protein
MSEFFTAGGFGMYPTLVFGFFLVGCSILFMVRSETRYLAPLLGLGACTASAGLLGLCSGVMNTLRYLKNVPADDRLMAIALGTEESLHCLMLALILLVVAGIFVTIGTVRTIGLFRAPVAA